MTRFVIGLILLSSATSASAGTDFGIRTLSGQRATVRVGVAEKAAVRESTNVQARVASETVQTSGNWAPIGGGSGSLNSAANVGSHWGRVTSTYRTPAHNRAVGGVRNSYHLRGRAIDIARRPGVTHSMIAAAFRNAGYQLVESLDEGDHSHFAFAFGGSTRIASIPSKGEMTQWGVVTVSSALLR